MAPALAGKTNYKNTGGPITCFTWSDVEMYWRVDSTSVPVTGYYIYGAAGDGQDPPEAIWTNTFHSVNVPPGAILNIDTGYDKWYASWNGVTSRIAFVSASNQPAPIVGKVYPNFFTCE